MKPERIRLSRARGWRMPADAIKVDRKTIWGNPWRDGRPGRVLLPRENRATGWEMELSIGRSIDAAHAVHCFRSWLAGSDPLLPNGLTPDGVELYMAQLAHRRRLILERLAKLQGRPLACWCVLGAPCHADVLLELANRSGES